ncbi:MAG TPA: DUF72 domain-containing protein [Candidatus Limnocylindrales bacterium]|nr:DUF72 domain-containing protein [Candidatus Limnocylindrales bacterium]
MIPGRLLVGTSGFAYPDWAPRFYPPGRKGDALLPFYAGHFPAVELNNTFYARPTAAKIASWVAATPPGFRFVVKAQRGSSMRAMGPAAAESVAWLTEGLDGFGQRLGAVLFRVPHNVHRKGPESGAALARLLAAWPSSIPLAVEFQHATWHVDETFAALREAGATLCATDLPDEDAPTIRVTGPRLYLRLRRHDYAAAELAAWADRLRPFLADGLDAYVFFRHDETGRATELADALRAALG